MDSDHVINEKWAECLNAGIRSGDFTPTESPDSLFDWSVNETLDYRHRLPFDNIPPRVWEILIEKHQQRGGHVDSKFVEFLQLNSATFFKTTLYRIGDLTTLNFRYLIHEKLTELELGAIFLDQDRRMKNFLRFHSHLKRVSLSVWTLSRIFSDYETTRFDWPNLESLELDVLSADLQPVVEKFFPVANLKSISLTRSSVFSEKFPRLEWVGNVSNLRALNLHDMHLGPDEWRVVTKLKKLIYLNLSVSVRMEQKFAYVPSKVLANASKKLRWLDISGRKLDGSSFPQSITADRFEFVGVYDCGLDNCRGIPAKNIAGDYDENQILTAMTVYSEYPTMLRKIFANVERKGEFVDLNKLFQSSLKIFYNCPSLSGPGENLQPVKLLSHFIKYLKDRKKVIRKLFDILNIDNWYSSEFNDLIAEVRDFVYRFDDSNWMYTLFAEMKENLESAATKRIIESCGSPYWYFAVPQLIGTTLEERKQFHRFSATVYDEIDKKFPSFKRKLGKRSDRPMPEGFYCGTGKKRRKKEKGSVD